jgi:hypothetical protein
LPAATLEPYFFTSNLSCSQPSNSSSDWPENYRSNIAKIKKK